MELHLLPHREKKPRLSGATMVMDKGLGIRQAMDLVDSAGHLIDYIKLGFGTSMVGRQIKEKVRLFRNHDIKVFVGGTLFEAFLIRDQFDDYRRYIDALGCDAAEVSDGSIELPHEEKCHLISRLTKDYLVLSEVGAKDAGVHISNEEWTGSMTAELAAGSSYVIAEARESGTVGIYGQNGSADENLIELIQTHVPAEKIIWEAPLKQQQVWFIRQSGANVNLGNISPDSVAALETLRLGLRGDTFFTFLPEELKQQRT